MSGGRVSKLTPKDELKAFFKKYKINEVNGIKAKYFIQTHGEPDEPSDAPNVTTDTSAGPNGIDTTTAENGKSTTDELSKEANSAIEGNSAITTSAEPDKGKPHGFSGGAGMNPGFQAFLNLKKKIAEELKISNGPKAAKIAGAVQKEMKAKYTNLNSVEIAEKGLEHFKKNHDKYKKMV